MMESKMTAEQSVARVKARISNRQSLSPKVISIARSMAFASVAASSPTKEMDAVVLANTLIGYGEKITLENMAIIENLIKFAKLEASFEVPQNDPRAWYLAFLQCMDEVGCFVADSGYTEYDKSTRNLTMDNIVIDIVKAGVEAAKAAVPAAAVFSVITDSTLDALKKEPEAINLFNREVTKDRGVKLAIMPCDQLDNGIIMTSLTSIDSIGDNKETAPLFFNWKASNRNTFRGTAYITFNPLRYAALKNDLEEYLGDHFKAALSKRFERRKKK